MIRLRTFVFRLYEQRRLRNWFYTVAFATFVPVGYRFATLAWRYGSWIDKPLVVIAGILIGITTVVTLMRVWHIPPRQTSTPAIPEATAAPHPAHSMADEVMAAERRRATENRVMALDAAALGSTGGKGRYR
jgi:hypothetical protein